MAEGSIKGRGKGKAMKHRKNLEGIMLGCSLLGSLFDLQ